MNIERWTFYVRRSSSYIILKFKFLFCDLVPWWLNFYKKYIFAVAIYRTYCIYIYNNDLIDNKYLNGQEELKWNQGTYLRDWWM